MQNYELTTKYAKKNAPPPAIRSHAAKNERSHGPGVGRAFVGGDMNIFEQKR